MLCSLKFEVYTFPTNTVSGCVCPINFVFHLPIWHGDRAQSFILRSYTMHHGRVEIFLVASCHGNRDKLRPDGPLGSYADFTMHELRNQNVSIGSSVGNKQLLCFVHGQGKKSEQIRTTKKFVGFPSHSPLLTKVGSIHHCACSEQKSLSFGIFQNGTLTSHVINEASF